MSENTKKPWRSGTVTHILGMNHSQSFIGISPSALLTKPRVLSSTIKNKIEGIQLPSLDAQ